VPLSVEEISTYLNAYGTTRWELALCPRVTLDDIDMLPADLLLGLEAAAHDSQTGQIRPTNAGMLMFGYDPQLPLPQSEVVCIKYADPLGVRQYVERKNFLGTLPELIDKASSFLKQYIRVGATIRGFYREDEPEYPSEALRLFERGTVEQRVVHDEERIERRRMEREREAFAQRYAQYAQTTKNPVPFEQYLQIMRMTGD
jgi:hypothetical protein